MSEQDRFDELWNDYLEGDLDEAGMAELKELLAADETRVTAAVGSFQTHRLLGLEVQDSEGRHEAFVRQTMDALPTQDEAFVNQVIQGVSRPRRSNVIPWFPNWVLSAAAALAAVIGILFLTSGRSNTVATISDLSGPAL